jgi:hypothetical protein
MREELSARAWLCGKADAGSGLACLLRIPYRRCLEDAVLRIWCSVAGGHAHPPRSGSTDSRCFQATDVNFKPI